MSDQQLVVLHKNCRVCGGHLKRLLSLGTQYIADFVMEPEQPRHPPAPLILCRCTDCSLIQLRDTVPRDWMYRDNYWYRSGINESMAAALWDVVICTGELVHLKETDTVIDIGANDGTLLNFYRYGAHYSPHKWPKVQRIAFEPAFNLHNELKERCEILVPDYFPPKTPYSGPQAKIITSIAMFYDLEDPNAFVAEIKRILAGDGVWVIQLSDVGSMIETNGFDVISHEHLEYYSLGALCFLLARHRLVPFHCTHNPVNGGSIRVFVKHQADFTHTIQESVAAQLRIEADLWLADEDTWRNLAKVVQQIKGDVRAVVLDEVNHGRPVDVYGASTKGGTLLQYFDLDRSLIRRAIERSPDKIGKFTVGTWIPIVSEEQGRQGAAALWLVPIWHFKEGILKREAEFLKRGGRMLFPLPRPQIYGPDND